MRGSLSDTLLQKLAYFFKTEAKKRNEVTDFLNELVKLGEPIIFGGMLRDISLLGNREFYSDVDIVMKDTPNEEFKIFIEKYKYSINSFGGYRINLDRWSIDVWQIENTWAFKNNLVKYEGEQSLLRTTFFNWDAIIFNYKSGSLLYDETYFPNLENKILDINFEVNPHPIGIIKRTIKFLKNHDARATRQLCKYFIDNAHLSVNSLTPSQLIEMERIQFHMSQFLRESEAQFFKLQAGLEETSPTHQ